MRKTFKYRLYPTKKQQEILTWTLDRCRELYNAALQERRDAYRMCKVSVNYVQQSAQLPEIKEIREEYKDVYGQVLQDILRRVDKTFKAFFARCKRGDTPGYPRFKGKGQFDSFTYPQMTKDNGPTFYDKKIRLPKIGRVKIVLHRPLQGGVKTCTIKQEGAEWYAVFSCEVEVMSKLPYTDDAIGIDLGLAHFATLSTGDTIENPRYFRKSEKKLAKAQQSLCRKKKGSRRRKKASKHVGRMYRKVARQRKDFLHKQSRQLVNTYEVIVFEDIKPANLSKRPKLKQDEETGQYLPNGASAKSGLNKSIQDAGWSQFIIMCEYKAASASTTVVRIDPRYTSQICSGCGQVRKKELSERWHSCECGCELDRDHNAAINILNKYARAGSALQGTRLCVASAER